jgi:hypothetical protein
LEGHVSSIQDGVSNSDASGFTMHSLPWIGAINLDKDCVQKIKSDFKCWLCRSNDHVWVSCSHLGKWDIKKKVVDTLLAVEELLLPVLLVQSLMIYCHLLILFLLLLPSVLPIQFILLNLL